MRNEKKKRRNATTITTTTVWLRRPASEPFKRAIEGNTKEILYCPTRSYSLVT